MHCTPEITLKARKPHHCTWCGESINAGETYIRWASVGDSWFTSKVHQKCLEPLHKECEEFGGTYVPFDNEPGHE